jgi:hypothetical protein
MYDEFGDIMFNAPGRLVLNGGKKSFYLDEDYSSGEDLSNYRYRTDSNGSSYSRNQNRETEVLTTHKKNRYNTNQVWKFRPLEENKEKKIIKIEDEPVGIFPQNPMMYRSPLVAPLAPIRPYAPMMPMVPMMPGQMYPYFPPY